MDIRELKLGHTFTANELMNNFKAVWGGTAWPGKRAGFVVVVGIDHKRHFDSHDIHLLDEYESFDIRELVRKCGALDLKYGIGMSRSYTAEPFGCWIGDSRNDAASRHIQEMNDEHEKNRDYYTTAGRRFSLSTTAILEMENPYGYFLPQIKELLNADRRQLFLKDSRLNDYLREIKPDEIADLTFGAFPPAEALAFVVIEMRNHIKMKEQAALMPEQDTYGGLYESYMNPDKDVYG